jgi:hypothetical protein
MAALSIMHGIFCNMLISDPDAPIAMSIMEAFASATLPGPAKKNRPP